MVGNIGAALSLIIFPLMLNKETGSANAFFILAAVLNVIAIGCWLLMNPNRAREKDLSHAKIRMRFMAMIILYIGLLAGAIGYNMYAGYQKNKSKALTEERSKSPEATQESQPTIENR